MNLEEHAAKPVLAAKGVAIPRGLVCDSADAAEAAARSLGACVVKAQVPTGKRGKAGGIKLVATPGEAQAAAQAILGMTIGDHRVQRVLVEEQVPIARELYAAVLNDSASKGPVLLFSSEGGFRRPERPRSRRGPWVMVGGGAEFSFWSGSRSISSTRGGSAGRAAAVFLAVSRSLLRR